jgi:hypothetical protein
MEWELPEELKPTQNLIAPFRTTNHNRAQPETFREPAFEPDQSYESKPHPNGNGKGNWAKEIYCLMTQQ